MPEGGASDEEPVDVPAYAMASQLVRLGPVERVEGLTPEWAWGGSTGRGVRVAVIDSGIDADHPDLEGCVDEESGVALSMGDDGEVALTEGPHRDLFGHGTACAGIIHAMAPEARLTSVRVLNPFGGGKAAVFLRGLQWAVEQRYDVINLSMGTGKPEWALPFYELCDEAFHVGSLVVTAANNLPTPSFPSMYGTVVSCACHLGDDSWRVHYNPSPPPEFLARGVGMEVPWRGGRRMTMTGNSFAAPHVSGLIALIRAKHPDLRPYQVKSALWAATSNVLEAPRVAPASLTRTLHLTRAGTATRHLRRS
jgi:subtilisin family serine protease